MKLGVVGADQRSPSTGDSIKAVPTSPRIEGGSKHTKALE